MQPDEQKMYILVREDISPGYQLAQSIHAAVEFTLEHDVAIPRTVVVLSVPDEATLLDYADAACMARGEKPYHLFHEPDIDAHTALCTVSDGTEFSDLPLAGAAMV